MDEIRFTLQNGEGWEGNPPVDDVYEHGLGHMTIIGSPCPDFVVYPSTPEFGELSGRRGNIVNETRRMVHCPICETEGNKTVWSTEHGIGVILCSGCKQYVWTRQKPYNERGEKP